MKTSFLRHNKRLLVLAWLIVVSTQPVRAETGTAVAAEPVAQAPIQLAWDRVGSPLQIRA